jgi:hypothetical protein
MISAVSEATCRSISVVVRKAYGAGLYAMCGPASSPTRAIALPTAMIAVMGPEAAVNAVYFNKIQALPEGPGAAGDSSRSCARSTAEDVDLYKLASELVVDDVSVCDGGRVAELPGIWLFLSGMFRAGVGRHDHAPTDPSRHDLPAHPPVRGASHAARSKRGHQPDPLLCPRRSCDTHRRAGACLRRHVEPYPCGADRRARDNLRVHGTIPSEHRHLHERQAG